MKAGGAKINAWQPDFSGRIEATENALVQVGPMTKPCPLYFKPADVLAAFSGETEAPARLDAVPTRTRSFALRRTGRALSNAVRSAGWRAAAKAVPMRTTAPAVASPGSADPRRFALGSQVPPVAGRGLLSHFAMVQPSV